MSCDRCRRRFSYAVPRGDNPDQPLCAECVAHLRAGGAWALGAPTPGQRDAVRVDLLPPRAAFDIAPVPTHPTSDEFQSAAMAAGNADPATWEGAAARWHLEAVRERRHRPGCALDGETLARIGERTASRLAEVRGA